MPTSTDSPLSIRLSAEQSHRKAALLMFCDPPPKECKLLETLSGRQWQELLNWLDISGLALYFLDRLTELQCCDILPTYVLQRLRQSLRDNIGRTEGMAAESLAIQQQFQAAGLSYATLKGFSFCPKSVPRAELRHQFDLDFLVSEESASEARLVLERRDYRLHAISGRTWEFKTNEKPVFGLDDIYKDSPGRVVELHVDRESGLLRRTEIRDFYGVQMPVLSPVDLFLGQGMHVYKHVCSEFARAAHLLEFRRHVLFYYDDHSFWDELRVVASENPRAVFGLGVVTQLITSTIGDFAPKDLTSWTVGRLPRFAQLWIDLYGHRVVFDKFPGSKLYLLLQRELRSAGAASSHNLGQKLLPRKLPSLIIRPSANETWPDRVRRYRLQLSFVADRLRFHVVEGFRYARESHRWRQNMNGAER